MHRESRFGNHRTACGSGRRLHLAALEKLFQDQTTYLLGALKSIAIRFHQDPAEESSGFLQTAYHPFGRFVGDAPGWLARIVRPVANANLWLHTRSAFLSG
jgi:hypothetical protein